MAVFSYQALNAEGKKIKGVMEGDSPRQIRQVLRDKGWKPLEINASEKQSRSEQGNSPTLLQRFRSTRLNTGELALFTRQLATLVQSNLPLDEALQAVADQTARPAIKSLVLDVRSKVVEGHTLAYAMGEFPRVFNTMYRAMVQAGEHAGFLGAVLERLADYTESNQYTQQKLKMAMIYPAALVCVAVSVISALMIFVVPKLIKIFESKNTELPILTRALVATSHFMVDYGIYALVAIVFLVIGIRRFLQMPTQRYRFHAVLLRMPFFGNIFRTVDSARFSSTLGILIASGVPLLQAIRISGAVLSNLVLQDVCAEVATSVQEGSSFNKALAKTGQFPPMLVHMVASGEASGELETMLDRVAKNQNREMEMTLGAMMSILEPVLIIVMGGFVLLIVLAVLMPIFQMNSMVGR